MTEVCAKALFENRDSYPLKCRKCGQTDWSKCALVLSRAELIKCLKTIRFNLTSAGYEPNSIMIEGIDAVLSKAEAT